MSGPPRSFSVPRSHLGSHMTCRVTSPGHDDFLNVSDDLESTAQVFCRITPQS
jgi:hypothetical protein